MKQEMIGWQWHQLDNKQINCTLLQTGNHAGTSPPRFYRPDALPGCPTHSVKALKELETYNSNKKLTYHKHPNNTIKTS